MKWRFYVKKGGKRFVFSVKKRQRVVVLSLAQRPDAATRKGVRVVLGKKFGNGKLNNGDGGRGVWTDNEVEGWKMLWRRQKLGGRLLLQTWWRQQRLLGFVNCIEQTWTIRKTPITIYSPTQAWNWKKLKKKKKSARFQL